MNDIHLDPAFGASLFARLRQNIVDNMPTGSHQARADAWRRLARRCDAAADAHAAVVQRRQETRQLVRSFAPAYRQTALDALGAGLKVTLPELPAGMTFQEGSVSLEISPEDFRAAVAEEIQKQEDRKADERLLAAAAKQQGKAGFCTPWPEAQLKLDAGEFTAIPAVIEWSSDDLGDDPDAWYAAEVARAAERGPA